MAQNLALVYEVRELRVELALLRSSLETVASAAGLDLMIVERPEPERPDPAEVLETFLALTQRIEAMLPKGDPGSEPR